MFRVIKIILDRNQGNLLCLIFISALLGGMLLNNMQCVGAQEEGPTIEPDDKIQSILANIISPTEEDKKVFSDDGEKFLKAKLAELEKMVDGDHEKLVPQLIYYHMHAKDEREIWLAPFIIEQLGISNTSIFLGLFPYLDTKDGRLRKEIYDWLSRVEYDRTTRTRDYSYYQSFIETRKDNPPQGLIRYMYWRSPEMALLALMDIYYTDKPQERENIIRSDQIIREDIKRRYHGPVEGKSKVASEAQNALTELSNYNQWWIHLYVAEIMHRQPEFRTPEILERLKKDKHPLVSEAVSRFSRLP